MNKVLFWNYKKGNNWISLRLGKNIFFTCWTTYILIFLQSQKIVGQDFEIHKNNLQFIEYPNFPEAHSTWFDIGYNSKYNNVYVGVTNHHDKIGLYEYDVSGDNMSLKGFLNELAHLREFQLQGKVHSKIIAGPDGNVYFSTDGGENRQEYLMNHPHGYAGGFFMKWNPTINKLTNLGKGLQYESIKELEIDSETGKIYPITYPQVHFLVYDPSKNDLHDLGRLGSSHVPRVMFTDQWGNCYYVDWRQRLVKYEKNLDKLVFANESLPAFSGTPGNVIFTGIMAFAKSNNKDVIYLITYGGKVLAFHPQAFGIGTVEDLGSAYDDSQEEKWLPYAPNLGVGNNGKLYYFVGAEGRLVKKKTVIFMEMNPKTRGKKELYNFPLTKISMVTGSNIKDKEGNLYYAALKRIPSGGSKPFMIKFNPEKEIRK